MSKNNTTQETTYTLYIHVCKENGKFYVGQTSKSDINKRCRNGKNYKHNILFDNDIQAYGWNDGFIHEILHTYSTKEEVDMAEKYAIERLINDYGSERLYNVQSGGSSGFTVESKCQPVAQLDEFDNIVAEYGSILEAAKTNGFNSGNISQCVRGLRKRAHGYKWEFVEKDKQ